jgi:hypothetical protein
MTKILLGALLQILVLIPFAVIFLKEKTKINFLRLLILA